MHLDPVLARRTQAGSPVVHGMNALLWAFDVFCAAQPDTPLAGASVKFDRFILLETDVFLWLSQGRATKLVLRDERGLRLMTIVLNPSASKAQSPQANGLPWTMPSSFPHVPETPGSHAVSGQSGVLRLCELTQDYAHLPVRIGIDAINAIAGLSTLVGMVVPGLHSIYFSVDLLFGETQASQGLLGYEVLRVQEAFQLIDIGTQAAGLTALVKAFFRPPPTRQPSVCDVRPLVREGEFEQVKALVIGGSRGIGEVTAKILAAGGADLAITYAVGKHDAQGVADDIVANGSHCAVLQLDANQAIAPQLSGSLSFIPDVIFYFATTKIFLQNEGLFDAQAFARFSHVYVNAFGELCNFAAALEAPVALFYPSSTALDERPKNMTEYAMAKAAGEILCADAERACPRLHIKTERLPRLLTDQTATVSIVETTPIVPLMLSILRSMDICGSNRKD